MCSHVHVCLWRVETSLTKQLFLHTNTVLADESVNTDAAERAFGVGTNLIQTMAGKYPVTTFIYI